MPDSEAGTRDMETTSLTQSLISHTNGFSKTAKETENLGFLYPRVS